MGPTGYNVVDIVESIYSARGRRGMPLGEKLDLAKSYDPDTLEQMRQSLKAQFGTDYRTVIEKPLIENGDDVRKLSAPLCSAAGVTLESGVPIELFELTYGIDATWQILRVIQRETINYDLLLSMH